MNAAIVRWIMAGWFVLVAAVFVASVLPIAAPPGAWGIDKIAHVAVFLVLAVVPAAVLSGGRAMLGAEASLLVLGLGTEVAQSIIPGRVGSGVDFLADVLGILLGAAVGRQIYRRLGSLA